MSKWFATVALTLGCVLACGAEVSYGEGKGERSFPITESWSVESVLALTRDEVIELWKSLEPPEFTELNGHYMGLIPNAGNAKVQKGTGDFMYNENSVRGYWLGKAYKPTTATKGEGYNRWRMPGGKVIRNGQFGTRMGKSLIDGKSSFMMYYSDFQDVTLIDELRKLDDYIYIGMGTTETAEGKRSPPGHFVLVGPTDEWVGVDQTVEEKK